MTPIAPGPLSGKTFAVKDVIDIAGTVRGMGSPAWRQSHHPAAQNAHCIASLLASGAELVGKADELTYSLAGQNVHYGTRPAPRYRAARPVAPPLWWPLTGWVLPWVPHRWLCSRSH